MASWLAIWAGVQVEEPSLVSNRRRGDVEGSKEQKERLTPSSQEGIVQDGTLDLGAREQSEGGILTSDDGTSTASSAPPIPKRTRRTSIPTFLDADRIKGFITRTTQTLAAALPSPNPAATSTTKDKSKLLPPPPPPLSPLPSNPSLETQPAAPLSRQQLASLSRKKEGFLWATLKPPVGHAEKEGGGQFHKCASTLSPPPGFTLFGTY